VYDVLPVLETVQEAAGEGATDGLAGVGAGGWWDLGEFVEEEVEVLRG
jgi:hypothetical protein